MDKYSFLNAAHTSYFAELYDKYLINPDSVEPSWRAFFQGFDFGMENSMDGMVDELQNCANFGIGCESVALEDARRFGNRVEYEF